MKLLLFSGLILGLFSGNVQAQINESHIISETYEYTIKSDTKAELSVHKSIFIGDEQGKEYGRISIGEDEFSKVKSIKGGLKSPDGKIIRKLRRRDITEYDASAEWALYSGETFSTFNLSHPSLPYIVEYSYRKKYETIFFWPAWIPQEDIPVNSSKYILHLPENYQFNIHSVGTIPEPEISDGGNTYTWSLSNIHAREIEYRMPPEDRIGPALYFSPLTFYLDGTYGELTSWESFGKWYARLAKDQYSLDTTALDDLDVPDSLTHRQTIEEIYDYLQEKTRYVAIELGIHGWKPHSAEDICVTRYGDCKDLTTFFIALLKMYGIQAYPVLIKTRDNGIIFPDFPSNSFNHVITCIPLEKDTLWVDCTNDNSTLDDLPELDEGCTVLIIGNEQGHLARTPLSTSRDNVEKLSADAEILEDGSLKLSGTLQWKGNSSNAFRFVEKELTDEIKRKILINLLDDSAPAVHINSMSLSRPDGKPGHIRLTFDCLIEKYANISNKRIFFNPNLINRYVFNGEEPEERKSAVYYNSPFTVIDSIRYYQPGGYEIEVLPGSGDKGHIFGDFFHNVVATDSVLIYTRRYAIHKRLIPVQSYLDYYKFREYVEIQDKKQVILRKSAQFTY